MEIIYLFGFVCYGNLTFNSFNTTFEQINERGNYRLISLYKQHRWETPNNNIGIVCSLQLHLTFGTFMLWEGYMLPLAKPIFGPLYSSELAPCALPERTVRNDGSAPLAKLLLPVHRSGLAPFQAM